VKAFADLYLRMDATTSSNAKVAAMRDYFAAAAPADAAWAAYFLAGGKPRQIVPVRILRELCREAAGLPEWLFDECYQAVGDLAETISLLLPHVPANVEHGLAWWLEENLLPLRALPPAELAGRLLPLLQGLDQAGQLVAIKLITGAFRVGVSKLLVMRALAEFSGLDAGIIAQRFVGYTNIQAAPGEQRFLQLLAAPDDEAGRKDGRPYPFFLAHPLLVPVDMFDAELGPVDDWLVEWKWDGIRAQLVKRGDALHIWSRGEELITERFPELAAMAAAIPEGTVIDGEIVVWKDDRVQPFALLQQRIARKKLTPAILNGAPAAVLAYDLLEFAGKDWRQSPLRERRPRLEHVVASIDQPLLRLSPVLRADSWSELAAQREQSRANSVEGLMLKEMSSAYGSGRTKNAGIWWKWKIDPYTVDAVLVYAERGHGRRASLYTDYTFALWNGAPENPERALVAFAKAYSGLTDAEIREVDAIVRATTTEQFGPVRSVEPQLVFELAFEGIARSRRHKSGVAVRFPRMLRWRRDKPVAEADTLAAVEALLDEAQALAERHLQ
jgi:DNA ligase 1